MDLLLQWYAFRTKSRHEKLVSSQLERKGIEQFLPTYHRISQWKDRKKRIEVPLFNGYCFARISWRERLLALEVPGVVGIVGQGGQSETISEEEIEALRSLKVSGLPYNPHPWLKEGMMVQVIRGPLMGLQGILIHIGSHCRLVIRVNLIKQGSAVEINADEVIPIPQKSSA